RPSAVRPRPRYSPRRGELELAAAARRGEDLARVGEAVRIEGGLEAAHRVEIRGIELQREVAVLLHADPVLAGDRSAGLDARGEDLEPSLMHARQLRLLGEQDERMQVAVAGVKYVRDAHAVPRSDFLDRAQH